MSLQWAVIIFYLIFIVGFIAYSVIGIYHLWRFSYSGDLAKLIITIYAVLALAIILGSLLLILLNLL